MAAATLEHVNITVSDPARTAAMLCRLFDWRVRWEGPAMKGGRTFHVGNDDAYLAVYAVGPGQDAPMRPAAQAIGRVNHVGVLVDDIAAVEARVVAEGLQPFNHGSYSPGRRFYLLDPDGIEYEVVSYD